MPFVIALAALALSTAAPTDAPPTPTIASANAPQPAPTAGDDQVVCKTIAVTGTRFPTRECRTKGQWAAQAAAAREFTDKATMPTCGTNCGGH